MALPQAGRGSFLNAAGPPRRPTGLAFRCSGLSLRDVESVVESNTNSTLHTQSHPRVKKKLHVGPCATRERPRYQPDDSR